MILKTMKHRLILLSAVIGVLGIFLVLIEAINFPILCIALSIFGLVIGYFWPKEYLTIYPSLILGGFLFILSQFLYPVFNLSTQAIVVLFSSIIALILFTAPSIIGGYVGKRLRGYFGDRAAKKNR